MFIATLSGFVGSAPEIKFLDSGKSVANFSIAHNNRDKSTTWVRVAMWGKIGEIAADRLNKGALVTVVGSLDFNEGMTARCTKP